MGKLTITIRDLPVQIAKRTQSELGSFTFSKKLQASLAESGHQVTLQQPTVYAVASVKPWYLQPTAFMAAAVIGIQLILGLYCCCKTSSSAHDKRDDEDEHDIEQGYNAKPAKPE